MDERARPPAQRLGGHRQPHRTEPRQQAREGDLRLQPGQRRAQAVMDAVAERQVPRGLPAEVQPVRVGVPARVTVRRAQRDDHRIAAADGRPADLDRLGGEPVGRVVDRVHVPEQFLHRAGEQRRVGLQPGELARIEQQCERAAGDQVDRGLMSGHQQQEHHGDQLVLPEPVPLVPGRDQRGKQVVGGLLPLGRQQRHEVTDHRGGVRLEHLGRGRVRDDGGRPVPEVVPVLDRDAEELADHRDRQRESERGQQVDLALTGHAVE